MKRLVIVVMMLAISGGITCAQHATADFRGFSWGASFSQVQKDETARFVSKDLDDLLVYEDQLAGSDCRVNFQFNDNDKLVSGSYIFLKMYSVPQLVLQDYYKFKNLLATKYGKPMTEKEEWRANTTPADKQNYGQAISEGNLTLTSVWTTERSIIKITLISITDHPSLQIHYMAKGLDALESKEDLNKALPKL
ncbi:MAG TPA: hypothetical protein PKG48_09390 [Bacteroidales bacterium]|nr:hypothetical protein [Bacteroidales bacterium]HPS62427.1 hypothetical protein [Bacteroidales bacterium]